MVLVNAQLTMMYLLFDTLQYSMSQLIKTSLYLQKEDKQFIDDNYISLTKFVRANVAKLKKSNGFASNTQPLENQPGDSGGSNG